MGEAREPQSPGVPALGPGAGTRPPPEDAPAPRRLDLRRKLALAVATLFAVVVAMNAAEVAVLWSRVPAELRGALARALDDSTGLIVLFALFMLVALGLLVGAGFRAYVERMAKLGEGARIILTANPAHRLADDGPIEAARLARLINAFADRHQSTLRDIELRVRDANAKLEEEKHRLAALMSDVTSSVLVCNPDGLILLYNDAARALFDRPAGAAAAGIVGLGRSVFGVIDRDLIAHALDIVRERLHQGEARPVAQFVTTTPGGELIRAHMAPVLGAAEDGGSPAVTGLVLTLDDVTGAVQSGEERDRLVQSLTEETRAGLASIRAAVEAIIEYDAMEPARREQFTAIIRDEAVRLSGRLDALGSHAGGPPAPWPLEEMQDDDLLFTLQRALSRIPGVVATAEPAADRHWLKVDSFGVVQAFTALASRLRREFDVHRFALRLAPAAHFANLELTWRSPHTDATVVSGWDTEPSDAGNGRAAVSLRDVAQRHGGEQWCRADHAVGTLSYCLQLPAAPRAASRVPAAAGARPVFYDFELFDRPGRASELETRPLAELVYTVFDTETTGLDPSAGDEIISISAVRIVNGRLLRHESFDQLVDPRRPLSKESSRIHGITRSMLEGQPTIDRVLPRFARFAEDTVLVGHNVAFDMRFLQLKERTTGQRFLQPVLDTLLLSAVVHPSLREHELEANARRLGVAIIGRHTSLGDAILTGGIFIKLIPLLAAQGIATLGDALAASRRTYLARVGY